MQRAAASRLALMLGLHLAMWPAVAQAAGDLRVSIDRREARLGEHLRLSVTVEGSAGARPKLPDLSPFEVHSQGQSTQVQRVNGQINASVTHNYILIPKRVGTFRVGPATVTIGGQTHSSKPFSVKVLAAGQKPRDNNDLFVTAKVSNDTPVVGEQIIHVFRLYQRVQMARANLQPQEFDGFVVQELGEQRTYDSTVRGVEYRVTEIRKALFPQEATTLTVPPTRLEAEVIVKNTKRRGGDFFGSPFDDFFGNRRTESRVLTTAPIEVRVSPLPPAPAGFSGLVGAFTIEAELSRPSAPVGETTTLTVTVSGRGNASSIPQPTFRGLESFKIYDDKPSANVEARSDGVRGTRTFRKALVPMTPGEVTIPPIELTYFDPAERIYRKVRSAALPFVALPPTGKEELKLTEFVTPSSGKVAVKILADDILPIYRRLDALTPDGTHLPERLFLGGGLLLPALAFVGLFTLRRRRERLAGDTALRRRRAARARARRGLKQLRSAQRGKPSEAAEAASRVVRELIGDLLNLEGGALTAAEAAERLREAEAPAALADDVRALLDRCESVRYGGGTSEARDLHAAAEAITRRLLTELGQ